LSRENPQYWQLLTHSLLKYNGAKSRITRPKRLKVNALDCRDIRSSDPAASGEIRAAKSSIPGVSFDKAASTCGPDAANDRETQVSSGNRPNSSTKLIPRILPAPRLFVELVDFLGSIAPERSPAQFENSIRLELPSGDDFRTPRSAVSL
jgi:hypothetical protein